jgi:hypothetical protein
MKNVGHLIDFPLIVETKDGKVESVRWSKNITEAMIEGGKKLTIKRERKDGKSEITGTLMQWVPKERLLTSKKLMDAWFKDRVMKGKTAVSFWDKFGYQGAFYIGKIYQMSENEFYSNRDFWCSDETTKQDPKNDDGIRIKVPTHVYLHNVKNKFGLKSLCLFAGKVGRDVEKDKNKKTKMQKIKVKGDDGKMISKDVPVYQKPHIDASCVIPIVLRKAAEEEDVGKVEIKLGDGISISDEEDEKPNEKTEDDEETTEEIPKVEITDEEEINKVFSDDGEDADDDEKDEINDWGLKDE